MMQPDESDDGSGSQVAVEGLPKLVKWQQFNAVGHSYNGHKMTNVGLQFEIQGIVKCPLTHYHSQVGNEVSGPGVLLPCRPPSGLAPFLPLSIGNTNCQQLVSPGV